MYKFEQGDLLTHFGSCQVDVVLHCCNCQGVMGSGIAATIKNDYPTAYVAYKAYETESGLTLGTISSCEFNGGLIVNLHAQDFYRKGGQVDGRFVNYEALYESLLRAKETLLEFYASDIEYNDWTPTVGVPYKMAADRAGGDWNVVLAMIKSVFPEDGDINVTVVEYNQTRNA